MMILFTFKCKDCGKEFETLVKRDELDKVTCPDCEGKAEKIITGCKLKFNEDWRMKRIV